MGALIRFVSLCKTLNVELIPKAHLMTHAIHRSKWQGNPWFAACWLDEKP